ncbi:MAG: metallophosphoesterase [Polyangiaceae bacterium]
MSLGVRLVVSLVTISTLLTVVSWLVLRRIVTAFRLGKRGRVLATVALFVPLAATLLFRGIGFLAPPGFAEPAVVASSAFEAAVGLAGVALLFAGLLRAVYRAGRRVGQGPMAAAREDAVERAASIPPPPMHGEEAPAITRRVFVEQAIVGSAVVAGGTAATYGAVFGRHDYELATVPVPIPGLPRAADGFTIVQLSDIHLGQMVGEAEMRAAEELVRRAKGDLVVLTGDLIDHDPRYVERLGRLVRRLADVQRVIAIPGNHDYYTGIDAVLDTARKAGATVLVNESIVTPEGLVIAGLDDHRGEPIGRGPNLARAVAGLHNDGPRVVLCHNPKEFLVTAGDCALMISGHTHGGQINVGLPVAEMVLRHGYIKGLYEERGSRLYVNRGFGTAGAAVRVGSPPEVTRIVLVAS